MTCLSQLLGGRNFLNQILLKKHRAHCAIYPSMVVLKVKTKGILSIKVNHVICIWYVRPHLMETGYSAHFPWFMPTFTDHLIVCWSAMSQTIITFLDFSSFIVGQSNGKQSMSVVCKQIEIIWHGTTLVDFYFWNIPTNACEPKFHQLELISHS